MSVNKAILVGNVGADPEVRYLEGGNVVAKFPLATTDYFKTRSGENSTNTEWHNIVAWRHLAELAEKFIRKGRQLYIEGRISTRSWEDKDGNKRYTTEIVASSIQLLGKKQDEEEVSQTSSQPAQPSTASSPSIDPEDIDVQSEGDDLPF